MEQFKRAKVVMLPHNNINTKITLYKTASGKPLNLSTNTDILSHHTNQHLYIISDDEIKEGDLHITSDHEGYGDKKYKIIATTDTSLNGGIQKGKIYNINFKDTKYEPIIIPQPSQQFIEKYIEEYNKGNIITDVLVEYDNFISKNNCNLNDGYYSGVKINPKDNTITIKKVKDSWNKEDLHSIANEFFRRGLAQGRGNMEDRNDCNSYRINKWLEENL